MTPSLVFNIARLHGAGVALTPRLSTYTAYAHTNLLYASISAVHGSGWNGQRLVWSVHALLMVQAVIFRPWRTELQFTLMQFITHTFDCWPRHAWSRTSV